VISIDGEVCSGSARSIPSINLHEQLAAVGEVFTHFGGHDYACGFSLETRNLDMLRERLAARFAELDESLFRRDARVDAALPLGTIDGEFLAAHEMLQPFGAGNPQPLFMAHDALVVSARTFAPDCVELVVEDATGRATAVLWPSVQTAAEHLAPGARADLLFHVEPDAYAPSGSRLEIVDARNSTHL
jgi:single-stranded-DNA-specific exonuclease